jgi:hypothetical protein
MKKCIKKVIKQLKAMVINHSLICFDMTCSGKDVHYRNIML